MEAQEPKPLGRVAAAAFSDVAIRFLGLGYLLYIGLILLPRAAPFMLGAVLFLAAATLFLVLGVCVHIVGRMPSPWEPGLPW